MNFSTKRRMAKFKRKVRQARGKLRRFFLDKFRMDFIRRRLALRRGECKQCGKCCSLVYRCPFLQKQGDKFVCRIYDIRPAQCRHFPIDRRDLKEVASICGYWFETGDTRR